MGIFFKKSLYRQKAQFLQYSGNTIPIYEWRKQCKRREVKVKALPSELILKY